MSFFLYAHIGLVTWLGMKLWEIVFLQMFESIAPLSVKFNCGR